MRFHHNKMHFISDDVDTVDHFSTVIECASRPTAPDNLQVPVHGEARWIGSESFHTGLPQVKWDILRTI